MLALQRTREDPDLIKRASTCKGDPVDVDGILGIDGERRAIIRESEQLKSRRNDVSKQIGALKKEGKDAAAAMPK